jgi:hypothetical protein
VRISEQKEAEGTLLRGADSGMQAAPAVDEHAHKRLPQNHLRYLRVVWTSNGNGGIIWRLDLDRI